VEQARQTKQSMPAGGKMEQARQTKQSMPAGGEDRWWQVRLRSWTLICERGGVLLRMAEVTSIVGREVPPSVVKGVEALSVFKRGGAPFVVEALSVVRGSEAPSVVELGDIGNRGR